MDLEKISKKLMFVKYKHRDQIKIGTVLKLKRTNKLKLVGDVNIILGVCDDCKDFDFDDIKEVAYLDELFR